MSLENCFILDENSVPQSFKLKKLDQIKNWATEEMFLRKALARVPKINQKFISMTEQATS